MPKIGDIEDTAEATKERAPLPAEAERLLPALPPGPYVIEPEEIDRFYVRVQADGSLFFKGSRARIEEFLRACAASGLELRVGHIAYCG